MELVAHSLLLQRIHHTFLIQLILKRSGISDGGHRPEEDPVVSPILRVSEIHNLRNFQASAITSDDGEIDADAALEFLKRYLALIHLRSLFR